MFLQYLFARLSESVFSLSQGLKFWLGIDTLSPEDILVLENKFYYFKNLKVDLQSDFKRRLIYFIAEKTFIPRGNLDHVSREMKLLIGATAVMVTFGFRNVTLKHFKKILIYPDNYYSTINQQYHQGEVNPKLGVIVLSWKKFLEGLLQPYNGINLGIHEMAHALKLESQIQYNRQSNFFNPQQWQKFSLLAEIEIDKIRNTEGSLFRDSAARNHHEFFAVALETFFEKPEEFYRYNPDLFETLVFLLKQNPLALLVNDKTNK